MRAMNTTASQAARPRHRPAFALAALLAPWLVTAGVAVARPPGSPAASPAHLSLPALFGDHMVLQRDCRVPVWGTAAPGAAVTVALAGRVAGADADARGRWEVRLEPLAAGGPHRLVVASGGDTLRCEDVLVGEVWLASGQSNMEMPVDGWAQVRDVAAEVAAADHPSLRMLTVGRHVGYRPAADVATAGWLPCTPQNVRGFSACAYFFARELNRELDVPVGIVHASWGGTAIEAWIRADALHPLPELRAGLDDVAARGRDTDDASRRGDYERALAAWLAALPAADRGNQARPRWSAPALDDRDWPTMTLPCGWENAGLPDLDGVVWFRRRVTIPAGWAGSDALLSLARIDDADTTFFDGVPVGSDTVYDHPREYRVPAGLVTPGEHVIAVRVYDWLGGGGLWGPAEQMILGGRGGEALPLAGPWRYRVALDLADHPPRPRDPDDPGQPAVLAQGMIAPLVPYAIKGAIWYQGEANVPRAERYRTLLPLLIDDWRAWWGQGRFPFLLVQLANFTAPLPEPAESDWAELREAQAQALAKPRTGMAVAIDLGEAGDIHPRDKQEVGRRLALSALDVPYGRDVVASGPRWRGLRRDGATLRLSFDHAEGGLRARGGGELRGFAVAGKDRVFHWASARVEDATIVLECPDVPRPVAARYAWANNPVCNLVNGTGLPAAPFRTDDWPGLTHGRR
jgi:sialate O-acetylesterase